MTKQWWIDFLSLPWVQPAAFLAGIVLSSTMINLFGYSNIILFSIGCALVLFGYAIQMYSQGASSS